MRIVHGAIACSGMRMPGQRKATMFLLWAIMIVIALMATAITISAVIIIIGLIVLECSEPVADFVLLLWQVPRPPGADDLYEGIYEDFVGEEGRQAAENDSGE